VKRLRFVYRHFPLKAHPNAHKAAEAAEAAHAQARFWEMHALLFQNQLHLEANNLRHYAAELQLDMRKFETELDEGAHTPRVQADIESGLRSHIRSTPAFFVNGAVVDTSFGLERLMQAVARVAH